jgi:hypothetical protein
MVGEDVVEIKILSKRKIYMWILLLNKSPTWDNLQNKSFTSSGKCSLSKKKNESISHIFLSCPFTTDVWSELHWIIGAHYCWAVENIEASLKAWMDNPHSNLYKALPMIAT